MYPKGNINAHNFCSLKLIVRIHFFIEMTYSTGEINETRLRTFKYKYEWMLGNEIMEYGKTSLHYSNSYNPAMKLRNRRDNKKTLMLKFCTMKRMQAKTGTIRYECKSQK